MKINPGQLAQALEKSLAPVYLVSGDEPLLVQEACDQIRARARDAGFNDRQVYHADQHLNWGAVRDELGAMSLFAGQRRIEIHLPTGKIMRLEIVRAQRDTRFGRPDQRPNHRWWAHLTKSHTNQVSHPHTYAGR